MREDDDRNAPDFTPDSHAEPKAEANVEANPKTNLEAIPPPPHAAADFVASSSEAIAPAPPPHQPTLLERIGLFAPKNKPDPYAHRRGEPRSFIALWIIYVVGAIVLTLTTLGARGFIQVDVYRAGLMRLMLALMIGVVLVWPMVRLSQRGPSKPVRSFVVDAAIVFVPIMGVVLPQSLPWMELWSLGVSGCIALWCAAWSLVVAGVLAIVFSQTVDPPPSLRMAGAAVLALLCVMPAFFLPFVSSAQVRGSEGSGQGLYFTSWLLASPVTGLWDMLRDRSWSGSPARIAREHWSAGWTVLWVGLLMLAAGALLGLKRKETPETTADQTPQAKSSTKC